MKNSARISSSKRPVGKKLATIERLEKEHQAWQLSARGFDAAQSASMLGISTRTVERMLRKKREHYRRQLESEQKYGLFDAIHRYDEQIREAYKILARRNLDADKSSAVALLNFIGKTDERRNKLQGLTTNQIGAPDEMGNPFRFTFKIDGPQLNGSSEDPSGPDQPAVLADSGAPGGVSKPEETIAAPVDEGTDAVLLKDFFESRSPDEEHG